MTDSKRLLKPHRRNQRSKKKEIVIAKKEMKSFSLAGMKDKYTSKVGANERDEYECLHLSVTKRRLHNKHIGNRVCERLRLNDNNRKAAQPKVAIRYRQALQRSTFSCHVYEKNS